jgi:hypothetical protein
MLVNEVSVWSNIMSNIFLSLEQPYSEAIDWAVRQVSGAGLQVLRTFDLQDARLAHMECPCPHHGTDSCNCQMVVLLVFADNHQPVSLVAHSHDGKTWFSLVDTSQQRADPYLESTIRQALAPQGLIFHSRG